MFQEKRIAGFSLSLCGFRTGNIIMRKVANRLDMFLYNEFARLLLFAVASLSISLVSSSLNSR